MPDPLPVFRGTLDTLVLRALSWRADARVRDQRVDRVAIRRRTSRSTTPRSTNRSIASRDASISRRRGASPRTIAERATTASRRRAARSCAPKRNGGCATRTPSRRYSPSRRATPDADDSPGHSPHFLTRAPSARSHQREVDDELRAHLEHRVQQLIARGVSPTTRGSRPARASALSTNRPNVSNNTHTHGSDACGGASGSTSWLAT